MPMFSHLLPFKKKIGGKGVRGGGGDDALSVMYSI